MRHVHGPLLSSYHCKPRDDLACSSLACMLGLYGYQAVHMSFLVQRQSPDDVTDSNDGMIDLDIYVDCIRLNPPACNRRRPASTISAWAASTSGWDRARRPVPHAATLSQQSLLRTRASTPSWPLPSVWPSSGTSLRPSLSRCVLICHAEHCIRGKMTSSAGILPLRCAAYMAQQSILSFHVSCSSKPLLRSALHAAIFLEALPVCLRLKQQ